MKGSCKTKGSGKKKGTNKPKTKTKDSYEINDFFKMSTSSMHIHLQNVWALCAFSIQHAAYSMYFTHEAHSMYA